MTIPFQCLALWHCMLSAVHTARSCQVGGNGPGLQDGSFESACFNRPQGLAYSAARDVLYVADTEAHALREIDLKARTVKTLAGGRGVWGGPEGYLGYTQVGEWAMWCSWIVYVMEGKDLHLTTMPL